jgi:hypothetical protein
VGGRHQPQDRAGEPEPQREDRQALDLVAQPVLGAADAEAEPAVGGGVRDGGEEQRHEVRLHRAGHLAQAEVEDGVRDRGEHPDHDEHRHLEPQPSGACLRGDPAEPDSHLAQREPPARQAGPEPYDAAQVVQRGLHDVDATVGVVDPVDGHLVDPEPGTLGDREQLGVEEPLLVVHERQQLPCRVAADRLEAALGVAEPDPQRPTQDQVVAAGDQLALHPALDPRRARQPRPDREIGVAADQRGDQRQQGVEVGRQVDVHVDEDVAVGPAPRLLERTTTTLLGEVLDPDLRVLVAQPARDDRGAIGGGVVGDRDPEAPGQVLEGGQHPVHRRRELGLLVVHRDHHVEDWCDGRGRGLRSRVEGFGGGHAAPAVRS